MCKGMTWFLCDLQRTIACTVVIELIESNSYESLIMCDVLYTLHSYRKKKLTSRENSEFRIDSQELFFLGERKYGIYMFDFDGKLNERSSFCIVYEKKLHLLIPRI